MTFPPSPRNWFDAGASDYARFRPEYPPELAAALACLTPRLRLAVDVGCGNGQLTRLLSAHYEAVVGLDPSADQLSHAGHDERITYLRAPAEQLPLDTHSADLITAAQAAHWFDLPAFYQEVRRVAVPGGVLALISYGVLELEPSLNDRFQTFYWNEIGPYWPPERKLVDEGYAGIDFPFKPLPAPKMHIEREWQLSEFLGYLQTWSAVRHAKMAGQGDVLVRFADALAAAWGDGAQRRPIRWPLNMRIGRLLAKQPLPEQNHHTHDSRSGKQPGMPQHETEGHPARRAVDATS